MSDRPDRQLRINTYLTLGVIRTGRAQYLYTNDYVTRHRIAAAGAGRLWLLVTRRVYKYLVPNVQLRNLCGVVSTTWKVWNAVVA